MLLVNINGPINSGKSTISKLLAQTLSNSLFIEVDDLLSDEEKDLLGLTQCEGWAERINRLAKIVTHEKHIQQFDHIIFAYPMTEKLFKKWKQWEDESTKFISITLAPDIEVCLTNRGKRILTDEEIERIKEMYQEGYHNSEYADLIINNSTQEPEETLQQVTSFLSKYIKF